MAAACRARLTEPLRDGLFREVGAARVRGSDAAAARRWLFTCRPEDREDALIIADAQIVRAIWMLNSSLSLAFSGKPCDPQHTVLLELTDIGEAIRKRSHATKQRSAHSRPPKHMYSHCWSTVRCAEISTTSATMSIKRGAAADPRTLLAQLDTCLDGGFLNRSAILSASEYDRLLTKRLTPKRIKTWASMQDAVGAVFEQACLQAFERAQIATSGKGIAASILRLEQTVDAEAAVARKSRTTTNRRRRRQRASDSKTSASTVTGEDTATAVSVAEDAPGGPASVRSSIDVFEADAGIPTENASPAGFSSAAAPSTKMPLQPGWTLAGPSHRRRRRITVARRPEPAVGQIGVALPDSNNSNNNTLRPGPARVESKHPLCGEIPRRARPAARRARSAHRLLARLHRAGSVATGRRKVSFDLRHPSAKHACRSGESREGDAEGYSSDSGLKRQVTRDHKTVPLLAQLPAEAETWPVMSTNQWTTSSNDSSSSTVAALAATHTTAGARSQAVAEHHEMPGSSTQAHEASSSMEDAPTKQHHGDDDHFISTEQQRETSLAGTGTVPLWSVSAASGAHVMANQHYPAQEQPYPMAWYPQYANPWAVAALAAQFVQARNPYYDCPFADAASPADHVARDMRGILAGLATGHAAPIGAGAVAGRLDGDDVVVSLPAASHMT